MAKHSLGPWKYIPPHGENEKYRPAEIVNAYGDGIAYPMPMNLTPGVREANACLISCAPEMLEMVRFVTLVSCNAVSPAEIREMGERAVELYARATGGE